MGNDAGFTILVVVVILLCNDVLQAALGLAFAIGVCWFVFALLAALFSSGGKKTGKSGGKADITDENDSRKQQPVNGVVSKIGTI